MYLVDTDAISSTAPRAGSMRAELIEWMERNEKHLFVSTITIAEIQSGIAKVQRTGALRKARLLSDWVEALVTLYSSRILPFDLGSARATGNLIDLANACGQSPGFADLAIAGTAVNYNLTVLTHNLRHFRPLGVAAQDPLAMIGAD